ncbi:hypothetical protein [Streptomyces atratus]|uniref:hypothetical protein n=1 Tax=Streptomyces atratus TaxID=1893 RepID=UPI001670A042|nr:hypothetical protein [Streptomyces atratus]WPW30415.1 hypothetical protein P6B95_25615 [Streptomyces atratus]GGT60639.1 hypothetical protein GCM10010207_70300 [Streptomyces atratus]
MRTHSVFAGAVLGAVMVLGTAAAPAVNALPAGAGAAAKSAVTCGNAHWPHRNVDRGSGKVKPAYAAARTGPYGACTKVGDVSQRTKVSYDCYTKNRYGSKWTWVRDPASGRSLGWMYGGHLDDGGATKRCPR